MRHLKNVELVTKAMDNLNEAKEAIELVLKQLPAEEDGNGDTTNVQLKEDSKALKDSIKTMADMIKQKEGIQGLRWDQEVLASKLYNASSYVQRPWTAPNATQILVMEQVETASKEVIEKVNHFFENDWKAYRMKVENAKVSPFKKDYEPLNWEEK